MKQKMGQASSYPTIKALSDIMKFGKHKGKTVEYLLEHYPSYLVWLQDEKICKVSNEIYNLADSYSRDVDFYPEDVYDWMDEPF